MRRAVWINVAIGFWLVISAFTFLSPSHSGVRMVNVLTVGILLMGSALWSLGSPRSPRAGVTAEVVLGAWLMLSPFVLGYTPWNSLICGAVVIVTSLVTTSAVPATETP